MKPADKEVFCSRQPSAVRQASVEGRLGSGAASSMPNPKLFFSPSPLSYASLISSEHS